MIEEGERALAMNEELFEEPLPWEEYADSTFPDEGFRSVYRVKRSELRPFAWRMQTVALAYLYTDDMRFAEEARPFRSHPGRMVGFVIEGGLCRLMKMPVPGTGSIIH